MHLPGDSARFAAGDPAFTTAAEGGPPPDGAVARQSDHPTAPADPPGGRPRARIGAARAGTTKARAGWLLFAILFVLTLAGQWAFALRCAVPVEDEPDGEVYLALAHNVVAHGVYVANLGPGAPPDYYERLPGYPWMIAGVFALCGDGNLAAVRGFQALLATLTAALVAGLAFLWEPAAARRFRAALAAFLLAALCPFTLIYSAAILTETLTIFLAMLLMLAATWAFRARSGRARALRWPAAGLVAAAVQLVRPESGLFAAAIGFTLAGFGLFRPRSGAPEPGESRWPDRLRRVCRDGALFSAAFVAALVPWTLHNARVYHVYSPLPPVNAVAPGGMDYRGFRAWYRTWAESERFLQPFYWNMPDNEPASMDDLPPWAFDSAAEKERTAGLFARYNAPPGPEAAPDSARAGITRPLDEAFGQLARERAARSPWRYSVVLPFWRAVGLWFVPHAQYWDFEGSLFPLSLPEPEAGARFWLPVFFALTCVYSVLGLAGARRLAWARAPARADARRWLGLVVLIVALRWAYLATLENTEPRYMVEVFPFLCVLGGLALADAKLPFRRSCRDGRGSWRWKLPEILPAAPSSPRCRDVHRYMESSAAAGQYTAKCRAGIWRPAQL